MVEIRHDEILSDVGVERWTQRLARRLTKARGALGDMASALELPFPNEGTG
jgi:predicted N-formylglutamate amidohydrolase